MTVERYNPSAQKDRKITHKKINPIMAFVIMALGVCVFFLTVFVLKNVVVIKDGVHKQYYDNGEPVFCIYGIQAYRLCFNEVCSS